MADVWKSQGRKFCSICKVWFGDNRASIEFHERGRKHKDALAAKLRELGRASREKEKMNAQLNSALASMEAAAMKAMLENGEGLEHGPALPATGLASKIFDPRQLKDVGLMAREMAKRKNEMQEVKSQKRVTPPAPPRSLPAKYFKKELPTPMDYAEFTVPVQKPETDETPSSSAQIVWVEADAGDGKCYYFHMYTGESTWERPEVFYTAEDYSKLLGCDQKPLMQTRDVVKQETLTEDEVEESKTAQKDMAAEKVQTSVAPLPGVKAEPVQVDAASVPHDLCDIPLPETDESAGEQSSSADSAVSTDVVREESAEMIEESSCAPVEMMKTESTVADTSSSECAAAPEPREEAIEKPSVGPYGTWSRVSKVDSEPVYSPLTAKYRAEAERERKAAEAREKQAAKTEPVIAFTEKTSAILTKKVKGPIEFKKRTAGRNVRQRIQ